LTRIFKINFSVTNLHKMAEMSSGLYLDVSRGKSITLNTSALADIEEAYNSTKTTIKSEPAFDVDETESIKVIVTPDHLMSHLIKSEKEDFKPLALQMKQFSHKIVVNPPAAVQKNTVLHQTISKTPRILVTNTKSGARQLLQFKHGSNFQQHGGNIIGRPAANNTNIAIQPPIKMRRIVKVGEPAFNSTTNTVSLNPLKMDSFQHSSTPAPQTTSRIMSPMAIVKQQQQLLPRDSPYIVHDKYCMESK
jgi:hypothetical protein